MSLQLAKDQRLSLNPSQISGCCGRLMCCLMYEHRTYVEARRRFPREGKKIRTGQGEERVIHIDIWRDTVSLRDEEGERRIITLDELKAELGHRPEGPIVTEQNRRYLTTPIYYASGDPHIGHAYTTILADVLARFSRQNGADVLFLTGTDEHGPKIQDEAAQREMTPLELCDIMAAGFSAAWDRLDISHDRFIRTTEDGHKAVVTAFLERLWERGQIYEGQYSGWYCIHEERYWTEKDLGPEKCLPRLWSANSVSRGEELLLQDERVPGALARAYRGEPGVDRS